MPQVPGNNETVIVDIPTSERVRLYGQITSRMEQLGYKSLNYSDLDLGVELPADWPVAENAQPTFAELVVVAVKLKMKIIINNVYIEPHDTGSEKIVN